MNKQTLAVVVGAAVLLVAGIVGAMAFTSDSGGPVMTMPDGSTMPADQMTTEDMMTMDDGSTMPTDEMEDTAP